MDPFLSLECSSDVTDSDGDDDGLFLMVLNMLSVWEKDLWDILSISGSIPIFEFAK